MQNGGLGQVCRFHGAAATERAPPAIASPSPSQLLTDLANEASNAFEAALHAAALHQFDEFHGELLQDFFYALAYGMGAVNTSCYQMGRDYPVKFTISSFPP